MYIFGGDRSGYASEADKAANFASDDFRNDIWSYDAATDQWRCEATWDVPDGQIHPWRPDWGMFAWDSKRRVFWFRSGGSSGGLVGTGSFQFKSAIGLNWTYGPGRLMPDITVVPGATVTLVDNSTTFVEYDPNAHVVTWNNGGFTGGLVLPLYQVTTARGAVASTANFRPYWMTWGNPLEDSTDPRHYADPTHLISLDPTTMTWTDPGLARAEDTPGIALIRQPDGRVYINDWRTACMVYDPGGDQLVILPGDKQETLHYSFATNAWSVYKGAPKTQLFMCRYWFNESDRQIYAIEGQGQTQATVTQSLAWTYNVDSHAWGPPTVIPGVQTGIALWNGIGNFKGTLVGGQLGFATALGDTTNDIVWWPERWNELLVPYGYQADGTLYALHAWHFKENRFETINAPFDPSNHPHGTVIGFDPFNKLLLMYGHDAGATDRASTYYPALNPVDMLPYLYAWTPSGFTKPTWSTMP